MTAKRYSNYKDLFAPMADFAIKNGMTSYHCDLMYDGARICELTKSKKPWTMVYCVSSMGCGTHFYTPDVMKDLEEGHIINPDNPKATVKYDGQFFYFITED